MFGSLLFGSLFRALLFRALLFRALLFRALLFRVHKPPGTSLRECPPGLRRSSFISRREVPDALFTWARCWRTAINRRG
jgi:hypothetical protein